jgi:glycosyltransferase involved in cell wall biosynthesis
MSVIINILPQYKNFVGGPTFTIESLISESSRVNDKIIVLCEDGSQGQNVYNYKSTFLFREISILYYLFKIKPDIVHLHGRLHLIIPVVFFKLFFRNKILIFTFHTQPKTHKYIPEIEIEPIHKRSYYSFLTPFFSLLLNRYFIITAVSTSIIKNINEYTMLNISNYKIIPSGARAIGTKDITNKILLDKTKCNIFSIGVLTWDWKCKGYLYILNGIRLLKTEISENIKFYIMGDGPYIDVLKKFVSEYKIEKSVIFCGNVNLQEIELEEFDLYFHSGINEGSSLSLLEIIRNTGLNIFCFEGGGNEESVQNIPGISIFNADKTSKMLNSFYKSWENDTLPFFRDRIVNSWGDIYNKYYK